MKTYKVGGCVRDKLLGLEPHDTDYVIVGATQEDIQGLLDKGFKQVGSDFPVFLSPQGEEYALARTERKTGVGYNGFETYSGSDVTLEEDLSRRDLTINAMAEDEDGNIIDPFGGRHDLENYVLRHVSAAFAEDPVRVLRLARFLATLDHSKKPWMVASSTCHLVEKMYASGELSALKSERVWKELEKVLKGSKSTEFFRFLKQYAPIFEEIDILSDCMQRLDHHPEGDAFTHTMLALQVADRLGVDAETKFAVLMHDLGKVCYLEQGDVHGHEERGVPIVELFCHKWKVPTAYRDLALITTEHHTRVHGVFGRNGEWSKPKSIMKLFEETAALTKTTRFVQMLTACQCDAQGRLGKESILYLQKEYLEECLIAAGGVDTKSISSKMLEQGKNGLMIGEAIRVARIDAIRGVQRKWK